MRYAKARYRSFGRDYAYRIYVTDALKVLSGIEVRYADFVKETPDPKESSDEIIDRMRRKLGGNDESV